MGAQAERSAGSPQRGGEVLLSSLTLMSLWMAQLSLKDFRTLGIGTCLLFIPKACCEPWALHQL